jgi:hypothetical protein
MDDLPEVDQVEASHVARVIAETSPPAAAIVREHTEDNFGEVLPTVLLADIARWWKQAFGAGDAQALVEADRAVDAIDELYETGDDSLQTIVATGFLEALPSPRAEGREIVERLPPPLREELRQMENWTPG